MDINFKYLPLTGRLPGKSFVDQTERAINELAALITENEIPVDEWEEKINTAVANSEQALINSQQALEALEEIRASLAEVEWAKNFIVIDGTLYQKLDDSEVTEDE